MTRNIPALALVTLTLACGTGDAPATDTPGSRGVDSVATHMPDSTGAVLFLGTSLTAGYGLGAEYAYPALIQERIDSAGLPFHVVNAGLSGETSAGGLRRLDWSLQQPVDVLVLELGANDGLRALSLDNMRHNLDEILRRTRERYPDVDFVIAGMAAPPNLGRSYTAEFRSIFRDLAAKYDAALVPFLLEGVAAHPELNQPDGLHPTAEGQRIVASNVWSVLGPVLEERAARETAAAGGSRP